MKNLKNSAEKVSELLKVLSAPNRLLILCYLAEAELSVGELCELVGMKPPSMSQQLSRLKIEGLIAARREGQTIFYSIADEKIKKLMAFLYDNYCQTPE